MADKSVKVVGKHLKDCYAIKNRRNGTWDTEWGPIAYGDHGSPVLTTRRKHGKNGWAYRRWVRFVCNCVGCPAELHVEEKFIIKASRREYDIGGKG